MNTSENADFTTSGGFLPSPAPSSPAPSTTSISTSNLPHPRSHALKPGSSKENAARRYVEARLLMISRRYAKKFQPPQEDGKEEAVGYTSMKQVCKDLGDVVDVLWISGTPTLQIPNLLTIASSLTTYITAFPPSPKSTFRLLKKLDHAFSSLITGTDSVTGERLPGFEGGRGMSKTEMVRVKSLVEGTRVSILEYMQKAGEIEEESDGEEESEGGIQSGDEGEWEEGRGRGVDRGDLEMEMDVARVYEGSLEALNQCGFGFVPEEERIGIVSEGTKYTTGTG